MTSKRSSMWPAQEPPVGFAVSTAEAMLAALWHQEDRTRRPGIVLYLAIAAIFVTGSALAIVGIRSRWRPQLAPVTSASITIEAPGISLQAHTLVANSHAVRQPSSSNGSRKASQISPRHEKLAPVSSARPPLRQPACECERGFSDFICDCY
jgi:hypothetical protein